eukprot:190270-Ditylum_brightwellii.AAC.1
MTTTKTTTQAEIATMTAKAIAMPTKIVIVIDMTTIVTRKAKEATVVMAGKKEITIMLVIKASHTIWRKSVVVLAPNLRVTATVAAALQATVAFQAAATPIFTLCQTR